MRKQYKTIQNMKIYRKPAIRIVRIKAQHLLLTASRENEKDVQVSDNPYSEEEWEND